MIFFHKHKTFFCCLAAAGLFFIKSIYAQEKNEISLEDNTKAVFIYHFTKYITWPKEDSSETFNIAILGRPGITRPLKEIAGKKTVKNRQILITELADVPDTLDYHIIFIHEDFREKIPQILARTIDKNILTVGGSEGFSENGIMINFVVINGKIKFEINSDLFPERLQAKNQKMADFSLIT